MLWLGGSGGYNDCPVFASGKSRSTGALHTNFKLAAEGGYLALVMPDGGGFSLTLKDPKTTAPNRLNEAGAWRPSTSPGGSPGTGDPG